MVVVSGGGLPGTCCKMQKMFRDVRIFTTSCSTTFKRALKALKFCGKKGPNATKQGVWEVKKRVVLRGGGCVGGGVSRALFAKYKKCFVMSGFLQRVVVQLLSGR